MSFPRVMMRGSPSPISAAVLAGGRSARMGSDKAFVRWEGTPLLAHQLATLRELEPDELLVSGRRGARYDIADARVVLDASVGLGPLAGLAALLRAARNPLVVVLAVDMPRVTARFLRHLLDHANPGRGAVAATASGWEPFAAVYPRDLAPLIEDRMAAGQLAAQSLVAEAHVRGLVARLPLAGENLFVNVNTPNDLARHAATKESGIPRAGPPAPVPRR